jgi:EpsI family protein
MKPVGKPMAILSIMMLTSAGAMVLAARQKSSAAVVSLQSTIPDRFSNWVRQSDEGTQVALSVDGGAGLNERVGEVYDQVLMRTYRRGDGSRVMLAMAYRRLQRQEVKIHQPELCYYGQGFEVKQTGSRVIDFTPQLRVPVRTLLARKRSRVEPVTYWIRIGREISSTAWQTRWIIYKESIGGSVPDGILIRVSSLIEVDADADAESALTLQREFLTDLYGALAPAGKRILTGM